MAKVTTRFVSLIDVEQAVRFKALAEKQGRSAPNLIRLMVREYIEAADAAAGAKADGGAQ